jgi:hypothetical protein
MVSEKRNIKFNIKKLNYDSNLELYFEYSH